MPITMTDNERQPKILIVDTQPFNKMVQSRALDSYFHQIAKANLMQIFSDARTPVKGQCETLYQITDYSLLKRRFCRRQQVGRLFRYEDLSTEFSNDQGSLKKPKSKGPVYRFIRNVIWKKTYWDTEELEKLVETFQPDFIFVGFSKDFFIFDIALHFSKKLSVPLILSIADDYVFFDEYRGKLLNRLYRKKYLKLVNECFKRTAFCVFESEKINKKYTSEYQLTGHTIFISSDLNINEACEPKNKSFCYFGNLEYGRGESLIEVAEALAQISGEYSVEVYSKDIEELSKRNLPNNMILHSQIPYEEVIVKMEECFCLLLVEGFSQKNVEMTKYSLSTKVADYLSFKKPLLAYGDKECGAIDFLCEHNLGYVATRKQELQKTIRNVLEKTNFEDLFLRQKKIRETCFDLETQSNRFLAVAVEEMRRKANE